MTALHSWFIEGQELDWKSIFIIFTSLDTYLMPQPCYFTIQICVNQIAPGLTFSMLDYTSIKQHYEG